jgi:hypothetical protein
MANLKLHVSLGVVLVAVISVAAFAATFFEDFSTMPVGVCYPDGYLIGVWQFVFTGFGCSGFIESNSNTMLIEQPMASTSPNETHSSLVVGPSISGDFTLNVLTATAQQLRTGSAPNPWEVAWTLWDYSDNSHFYYFIAKPNGWELGKRDAAYPGSQRFLATGSAPLFPIGVWYKIGVVQSGATMRVSVNDVPIVTFTDQQRPYSSGRVGLYSEDAEAYFDNVSITTDSGGKGKKK